MLVTLFFVNPHTSVVDMLGLYRKYLAHEGGGMLTKQHPALFGIMAGPPVAIVNMGNTAEVAR
jgi:hypothetical protein